MSAAASPVTAPALRERGWRGLARGMDASWPALASPAFSACALPPRTGSSTIRMFGAAALRMISTVWSVDPSDTKSTSSRSAG